MKHSISTSPALDHAILRTVLYGDVFKFPMTAAEIHHFLIDIPASFEEVQRALEQPSEWLESYLAVGQLNDQKLYAAAGRGEALFAQRQLSEAASEVLWRKGYRYGVWLAHLPFVEMVAVTGALAVRNASSESDDLDYLLVVRDGRVWLARLFAVSVVRLCSLWGVTICPNFVLSLNALVQKRQDLFTAHEVSQMIPIAGQVVYRQMRAVNGWSCVYLPNADTPFYPQADGAPRRMGQALKRLAEWVLGGGLGDWLEQWEMRRKIKKFEVQAVHSVEAKLDAKQVKGHFLDYGQITMQRYQERVNTIDFDLPRLRDNHTSAAD